MKKLFYLFIITLLLPSKLYSITDSLRIALFYTQPISSVVLVPNGSYSLLLDSTSTQAVNSGEMLFFSVADGMVRVRTAMSPIGTFKSVALVSKATDGTFRVIPTQPKLASRSYDNDAIITCESDKLLVINHVELEKYVAGVVEAEAGPNAKLEFYKAQALLVRTYALGHTDKHAPEGFNLCDDVHCQAFKGRSTRNPDIFLAAEETKGLVVVDTTGTLITAAFHSSCGGQTANSEQVWPKARYYLVSVDDPYCLGKRNATWEKRIPIKSFSDYLATKGFGKESLKASRLGFNQTKRVAYYRAGSDSISFSRMRADLDLRSAFFSVAVSGNEVVLHGRGYGHGVGLCQIGAMEMAARGMDYKTIIDFYFKLVRIVPVEQVINFFPDARDEEEPATDTTAQTFF